MRNIFTLITAVVVLASCSKSNEKADAYGNFEAVEIMVSAESNGKILSMKVDEGFEVEKGDKIALVDTLQLHFKYQQLEAAQKALDAKKASVIAELEVLRQELKVANKDKNRIKNMLSDKAATEKQYDDILGKTSVLKRKIKAVKTQLLAVEAEKQGVIAQLGSLSDLIDKSLIKAPVSGTILQQYAELGEMAIAGKPVVKMADLSELELKVYIAGDQISQFKIGEDVKVSIDQPKGDMKEFSGVISQVSDKAEFTPKIIQTKEERVDMVYAVVIRVKNNGDLKIGMPAEVRL